MIPEVEEFTCLVPNPYLGSPMPCAQPSTSHLIFPPLPSIRIPTLLLLLPDHPFLHLLPMPLIQIPQQHIPIPLLALISTHIIAPTAYRTRQTPRYMRLGADLSDGLEVCADGEDYAAGLGEAAEGLPFGAEVVVVDCFVFLLGAC